MALDEALALELALLLLLITIGPFSEPFNSSTCFPHFGHITHSQSIVSPQCLQNLVLVSIF